MSLVSFARHTIEVLRAPQISDHGALYSDWDNATATPVEGCFVSAGPSTEDNDRQTAEQILYTVLAPWGTDVRATDKIRVPHEPGLDLAVHGRPRPAPSPSGNLNHLLIELREWRAS